MRSRSITSRLGLRGRANSAEDKAKVRQALIETGRHLFAIEGAARVSLRRIAAEAGYSPGSIYQYFQDHHALRIAIRELDMNQATDHFEAFAARIKDPVARVRKLFLFTVEYWLDHLDQFDALFGRAPHLPPLVTDAGVSYGQSPTVQRSLRVYYGAVDALFDGWPSRSLPARLAAAKQLRPVAHPRDRRIGERLVEVRLARQVQPQRHVERRGRRG